MQDGDNLLVPQIQQTVNVLGSVVNPTAVVYDPYLTVKDYLAQVGGPTKHADDSAYLCYQGQWLRLKRARLFVLAVGLPLALRPGGYHRGSRRFGTDRLAQNGQGCRHHFRADCLNGWCGLRQPPNELLEWDQDCANCVGSVILISFVCLVFSGAEQPALASGFQFPPKFNGKGRLD